jgi:hypothetical protein
MMSDADAQFQITAVRSPDLTDDDIRRRWNQVFEILLEHERVSRPQTTAPQKAKPKSPDGIRIKHDLTFEVSDDYLTLRRDQRAITIESGEVRALLNGLVDAAARMVSLKQEADSDSAEMTDSEIMPTSGAHDAQVDSFFSSAIAWLDQMSGLTNKELEALRQDAEAKYTGEQWRAFATAYSLYREFGP